MEEESSDSRAVTPQQDNAKEKLEDAIVALRQEKARTKTYFTKARRRLLVLIQEKDVTVEAVQEACEALDDALETAMDTMTSLTDKYKETRDRDSNSKLCQEIERLEIEYSAAQRQAQEVLAEINEISNLNKFVKHLDSNVPRPLDSSELPAEGQSQNSVSTEREKVHQPSVTVKETDYDSRKVPLSQTAATFLHSAIPSQGGPHSFGEYTSQTANNTSLIGQDLWRQLKKVTIPVFSGDKRTYQNWKAAFVNCVDQAPATPEYKLLQLRQCLAGEALKSIENLGYSATAYHAAMDRLERKFGGERRKFTIYLEEIDNFRPVRHGNSKDIEKYADLLDVAIVNLKESNRTEELKDGMLYIKLQKKLPAQMLAAYHRWVFENHRVECVEVLREWVIQEAEFHSRALETVQGLTTPNLKSNYRESQRTFFTGSQSRSEPTNDCQGRGHRSCRVCGKSHGVWSCGEFKQLDVSKRWENAKKLRLCFRCLGEGHLGQYCTRTRVCGLGGCKELHHRLLHSDLSHVGEKTVFSQCPHAKSESEQSAVLRKKSENDEQVVQAGSSREGDQKVEKKIAVSTEATLVTGSNGSIALRTIPVYLKNGNKKLRVNALLDDASTKTYLNADVAAEMGLQGELKKVNVSVLNGQLKSFETTPVECTIESLDGKTSLKVTALTTGKVTGNMRAVDWTTCADEWPHLRNIKFHKLGPRPIVDMLIGLDCADLHFSLQDIRGEPGQPIARLTPLGWTCVGLVDEQQPDDITNFARTYFVTEETDVSNIDVILQKFWEIDSSAIEGKFTIV